MRLDRRGFRAIATDQEPRGDSIVEEFCRRIDEHGVIFFPTQAAKDPEGERPRGPQSERGRASHGETRRDSFNARHTFFAKQFFIESRQRDDAGATLERLYVQPGIELFLQIRPEQPAMNRADLRNLRCARGEQAVNVGLVSTRMQHVRLLRAEFAGNIGGEFPGKARRGFDRGERNLRGGKSVLQFEVPGAGPRFDNQQRVGRNVLGNQAARQIDRRALRAINAAGVL